MKKGRIVTPVNYPNGLFFEGYEYKQDAINLHLISKGRKVKISFHPKVISEPRLKSINNLTLTEVVEVSPDTTFIFTNHRDRYVELRLPSDEPMTIKSLNTGFQVVNEGNITKTVRYFLERWNEHGTE